MNEKPLVDPSVAYRLLNPGCVVVVSVGDGKRDNLFAVTWNMPVRKEPPMCALVCGKRKFSYPLIEATGEFGLNVLPAARCDAILGTGTTSGRDVADKFERFGLTRQAPRRIRAPLVEEAVATLECRVSQVVDLGTSALLVAQILEARADAEHFVDGQWSFAKGLELPHHLSGSRFCISASEVDCENWPR